MHTKFWFENLKGKDHSERRRCRWEDNIRTDVRVIGWEFVAWTHLAQDCSEHINEPSIKGGKFLE